MHNDGRLYLQVAAESGVPVEEAMVACYLVNLARDGKTLDEAAALLRKERSDVRVYARDWHIPFPDYTTVAQPLNVEWRKERRGRWLLSVDDFPIAEAQSDGAGGYDASELTRHLSGRPRLCCDGSRAEVAIRRLSIKLERRSIEIFGVDDVRINLVDATGTVELMAPKLPDDTARMRKALHAA